MPTVSVTTPTGFKDAYDQFCAGGWTTLSAPEEFGGQGLPHVVATAISEYLLSANQAFEMYHGLTAGAIAALLVKGSDEQKANYVPKMVAGTWTGTMNLTEPHCGTDLGLLKTKAEPQADGSYELTGTKIFISSGEHDLAENIIHLVLAKIAGAPDNVKGISLFLVPKLPVSDDGSVGARNGVSCGSIEDKMGIHGNSTCVMNYDGANGLADRRARKGPCRDVHHDERGAAWRRPAGPGAWRGRLSECGRLCEGPAPGARARPDRARCRRQGRSDHRPSRRPPDADGGQGLQRGGARARPVGRAAGRPQPQGGRPRKSARPPTTCLAC